MKARPAKLEVWGGVECTRNRVQDQYFDQVAWTGHAGRPDDLAQFAELGLRTLRYPALWEWADLGPHHAYDWRWADKRLPRLAALGIRPIVGLVHHGSGPRWTSLIQSSFDEGLARYARAFAKRFPDVLDYTPVNEPLTTARFSTLYGHWYPHLREDRAFATAMLVQSRAIALAMRSIREIQPAARLVQTEDVGRTYSTPTLAYQADFDNARRWLTFDLLCGRVDRHHPIGSFFLWLGMKEGELRWFQDNVCPPDVLGINYYVTSERFLDERLENYPPHLHGGNGRQAYADVEAVRVKPEGIAGPGDLLREAYQRYRLPLAITEAHLGCSREEQVRWLAEVWREAQVARQSGIDVRAVTAWSLLGSFDWDSLVTQPRGHYEPGAFDARGPAPRTTALAALVRALTKNGLAKHPVLAHSGWWRRPERLAFHVGASNGDPPKAGSADGQPVLITGASGTLGYAFGRICEMRGLPHRLVGRQQMDIADAAAVATCIGIVRPWAIINAAGYVRVDEAERDAERCWRENVTGPATLAAECSRQDLPLVTFSSDLVFDGLRRSPYCEEHDLNPLNVYGRTKAEAEHEVLARHPAALIIRTSAFFGPWDKSNFLRAALHALSRNELFYASPNVVSPTYVPDLVHSCLDLLVDGASGIWHLACAGETSWEGLARRAARVAGFDESLVRSRPLNGCSAPRPFYSALGSQRAVLLPPWPYALERYMSECKLDELKCT
jgi:dTDP-4-dehydrorhamnose reductase